MNAMQEQLFMELRQTKEEIEKALRKKQRDEWLTTILKEELADIKTAINKMEAGSFGKCEMSGELLPDELLTNVPTVRSKKDSEYLTSFCKKPLY